jgi:GntR family transcriptional regulator
MTIVRTFHKAEKSVGNCTVVDISGLGFTPLDSESPVPLYHQIENDLRRLIGSGKLPPNATLPPEKDLCQAYGVSRHTMRKALGRLVADDLISRRAGRGTRIKAQADRMEFYLDRSFTRQMADMGRTAHSRVLKLARDVVDGAYPSAFYDNLGSECLRLVRLRFGDDEPIALQSSIVRMDLCPGLDEYDFNRESLYDVLAREYQLIITEIQHTISAVVADDFQAELLRVEHNAPLLLVKTRALLDDERVIESSITYYRADSYEYRTTDVYSSR